MMPGRDAIARSTIALEDKGFTLLNVALMFTMGINCAASAARNGSALIAGAIQARHALRFGSAPKAALALRVRASTAARSAAAASTKLSLRMSAVAKASARLVGSTRPSLRVAAAFHSRAGKSLSTSLVGTVRASVSARADRPSPATSIGVRLSIRSAMRGPVAVASYFTPSRILRSVVSIRDVSSSAIRSLATVVRRNVSF